jgi:multisubunit Na+/H+ antiporter MnhC subunit
MLQVWCAIGILIGIGGFLCGMEKRDVLMRILGVMIIAICVWGLFVGNGGFLK